MYSRGLALSFSPVEEIARVVGEEYGMKPEELLMVRSPYREGRRVLIEMVYRLNMSQRPLQRLGDELGGIGGAAVANNHTRIQKQILDDGRLSKRVKKIYSKLISV